MPPELLDTALGILRLSVLFVVALFLPLILQLLLLFFFGWALKGLVELVSPRLASLLYLIGVPVHEFSHAIAALITLCGVDAITPLIDETGEASVYPKRSHFLGEIASGLAPLFGGMLVLWLTATYIIPGFEVPTPSLPQLDLESAASLNTVLSESTDYLERFVRTVYGNLPTLQWDNWRTYIGLYIALSVGISIAPSSQDLKVFATGLPIAVALVLALFAWLYVSGDIESRFYALQEALVPHLLNFSTVVTYAFLTTTLGVAVFLPLGLWRALQKGKIQIRRIHY